MWIITKLFQKNKREDNRSEVAESFQNSFENDNSIEMAIDVADLAIEKFIDSDVVNGVPVVGLLNSAYKVYKNIQTYRLAKKVYLFLYHTNDIQVEKKRKFVQEYIESNQEDGIDALLSVIDQLDNQNKVGIMTNLLKARIEGNISIYEFNRLISCLQRIPFSDLPKLKDYITDNYEPGVTEVLYAAGALYLSYEDFEEQKNKYKLNYNGDLLLKYGLLEEIVIPKDYRVNRISAVTAVEVDDMLDQRIKETRPKLIDETLVYPDGSKSGKNEDDAQFLYDLARGK